MKSQDYQGIIKCNGLSGVKPSVNKSQLDHGLSSRKMTQNLAKELKNGSEQNTGLLFGSLLSPDVNPVEDLWRELKHAGEGTLQT